MIIGKAITAILAADTTTTALISNRVSELVAPEPDRTSSYPMVVYSSEHASDESTNDGRCGMIEQFVRLDCQATDNASADAVAKAVNSAMLGVPHRSTWGGIFIHGIFFHDEESSFLSISGVGADALVYAKTPIFKIWFNLPSA